MIAGSSSSSAASPQTAHAISDGFSISATLDLLPASFEAQKIASENLGKKSPPISIRIVVSITLL